MLSDLEPVLETARQDRALLDESCRLTDRLADSLVAAGFTRHFVPEARGGCAGTFTALLDAVSVVAETCASTAWCGALYAAHGRLASYLPEAGQQELWGSGPDVCVAASVVPPQGNARRTRGGWRLTGEWAMASGADQAGWVLLAAWAPVADGGAQPAPEHRVFAVRRSDVKVIDTWRPVGLRGTGSNTVEADVRVPEHLTFTLRDLGRAKPHAARCHTVPFPLVASLIFAAPVLGAAEGALRTWWDRQSERVRPDGSSAAEQPAQQQVLARTAAHVQAARLLLERAAQRADHAPVTPVLVAENQRDVAVAVELCVSAANELFRSAGPGALDEGDPLQRAWRDITAASTHGTLNFATAAASYAGATLAARARAGARR
ncbi:acyl-CoA dehydrogenase family protein [Streptomyces sp. B-S-A8]|uniref:Acyl-CoA dehydrogenase family protein n=1 Tax=Streptomyces solicavernae TaxID=3043614 RepID=A0ABT6S244_9ACTN|nr:acyl-CoA dehydrogenase family protein [Streptomyces sp. B-S-A8]MDI3390703.1 acyl-CoA dehydrogenase family protein [Streptomyces sp. B-S-A8]